MTIKLKIENISVEACSESVVKNVSLALSSGEVSILMGPNGSGKSTLVNALMGHPNYKITSGSLLLNDKDVTTTPTTKKAQNGLFLSLQHIPKIGGVTLATFLHKTYTTVHNSDVSMIEFYVRLRDIADEFAIKPELLDKPLTDGLSGGEKKLSEVLHLAVLKPRFAIVY